MGSLLDELYEVQKKDFTKAGQLFGEAFKDDPAWVDYFRSVSDFRRNAFFEGPARYCSLYGSVYAVSENLEGLAAWLPGDLADMTFWRILRSGLAFSSRRVGMKLMMSMQVMGQTLEQARREHMKGKEYNYLMTLGVAPEFQGRGYGKKLLQAVIQDSGNTSLYLETATRKNVAMYEKSGFTVIDEVKIPQTEIIQWCMIRESVQ